jgi:hypothetical protein
MPNIPTALSRTQRTRVGKGLLSAEPRRWRAKSRRAGVHPTRPFAAVVAKGSFAPIPDLPALASERGGSTLSGHSGSASCLAGHQNIR